MATKANPGAYDCYTKAADDEPIFTLRASEHGERSELAQCADDMESWRKQQHKPVS
jgi:hypothetical protein